MLQLGCDHCLSTEPVVEYGILLVVLVQDLEHNRAAERLILGQQDLAHRTFGVGTPRIGDRVK